jgi:hypothetical protein
MRMSQLLLCSSALLLGCGAEGKGGDGPSDAAVGDAQLSAPVPPDAAPPACAEGALQPCACGVGELGRQLCTGGAFGACEACAKPATERARCVAGRYRGHIAGTYRSEPAGLCGLVAGDEETLDFDVVFTLREQGDGEFSTVEGGCLRVPGEETRSSDSDGAYGLTFELTGQVDCATGAIDFDMRGSYISTSVCAFGVSWDRYFTEGKVTGTFDPDTLSFVDTRFVLRERMPVFGEPTGGQGSFTATYDEQAGSPDLATGSACLGVDFPADLAPQPADAPG